MKREDLKKIIPDITDEQITSILDLRSAEIGKATKDIDDLKGQIKKKDGEIEDYKGRIADLEKAGNDTEALQKQVKDLQDQIAERERAEKEAKAEKELNGRFDAAAGDGKFINDFTRNGIYAEFKSALDAESNKGKSDADIYAALIKDRSGIFENPNPLTGTGNPNGGGSPSDADDAKIRAAMGLPPKKES